MPTPQRWPTEGGRLESVTRGTGPASC